MVERNWGMDSRGAVRGRARRTRASLAFILAVLLSGTIAGCGPAPVDTEGMNLDNEARLAAIPEGAVKVTPAQEQVPPVLHSSNWRQPQPLEGPVNSAGAEDSPFITPDGAEFYFFFTPDLDIPVEKQFYDLTTGIWACRRDPASGKWSDPGRVVLGARTSLDGCQVVDGDTFWFGSVRTGNVGDIDIYLASRRDGLWTDIRNAGRVLNRDYDIGEFHVADGGATIYFDSDRPGGQGSRDIWVTRRRGDGWTEPENLGPGINTADFEGQPFLTPDGKELWFTGLDRDGYGGSAVFRSLLGEDGAWGPAEVVVSGFAGEPCLDGQGNLYFVHHLWRGGKIVEADIYVAERSGQ